ncbi:MAG: apolipoprotein N-acyltransferase [Desulfuromonadales bacterium]|mgnify:CR=1 FL=1|jgi:apolipoprotein N-acyltransferase|nr:apolipoprotein N-acyltransferase [Desulfuromonadales bacterium]
MKLHLPESDLCWALASGLLLALSFPRPDMGAVAWFGLVPLLLVCKRRPFAAGFAAGVGFFGLVLYWLNIVMTSYGHLHPVLSVAAYLMLVGYLATFFGVATWAARRLEERAGLSLALTLPILWVALEFLRSFFLTGFPWATLGYSQQSLLTLIQSADLFGPYGLSYLLVLSNATLALLVKYFVRRKAGSFPFWALAVTSALVAGNYGYGHYRLSQHPDRRQHTLDLVLAQGNIDQSLKWDSAYQWQTIDIYKRLSLLKQDQPPDMIVWPESAVPFFFQEPGVLSEQVRQIAARQGAWLLFGSPAYEDVNRRRYYLNSAFLLSPQGENLGRSDKIHLVPFGEYVPLKKFLPFIDKLVVGIGDFSPGTVSPLPMNGHRIGVLVCFEGIFPELARDYVRGGSDLLVNITNDAWFGRSSAPYQHLAMSRFRAVENRIWLARAANTGISALIAPSGRITARTSLFEQAALNGTVGLGAAPTLYNRLGDVFPAICGLVSLVWLFLVWRRGRR